MSKLPEEWENVRLGQVATFFKGKGVAKKDISIEGSECIRYGELFTTYNENITEIYSKTNSIENMVLSEDNDTLMPTSDVTPRGLATASALSKTGIILGGDILIIRSNRLLNSYLSYYIRSHKSDIMKLVTGSTVYHIYANDMKKFKINIPPLEEQKKIADILSTVDQKIAFVEDNISQTQELKKGLMQKLLTEGIGHTEFKETKIGKLPTAWTMEELNDISEITRLAGYEYSEYWNESELGDIIALKGYNIGKGKIVNKNLYYISNELSNQLSRSKLNIGDVVFPCVGTIGNAVAIRENNKYHINQNIAKISPKINLDSNFLVQYLMSSLCKKEIFRFNATTSQPNVLVGSLRKFRVPVPPIEEQKQIAEILSTVDQKLEILKDKKESFEELKKGLMQKLLTGEARV